jgi:hypothetical protein
MDIGVEGVNALPFFDVIRALVGKRVMVFTEYHAPLGGVLEDFNGYVCKLTNVHDKGATYYPAHKIIAIKEWINE